MWEKKNDCFKSDVKVTRTYEFLNKKKTSSLRCRVREWKNRHALPYTYMKERIRWIERQRECVTVKEKEEESAAWICMSIKRLNRKKTHNNNTNWMYQAYGMIVCICSFVFVWLCVCVCATARACMCWFVWFHDFSMCASIRIYMFIYIHLYRCGCESKPACCCSLVPLTTSCTLQWDLLCPVHVCTHSYECAYFSVSLMNKYFLHHRGAVVVVAAVVFFMFIILRVSVCFTQRDSMHHLDVPFDFLWLKFQYKLKLHLLYTQFHMRFFMLSLE